MSKPTPITLRGRQFLQRRSTKAFFEISAAHVQPKRWSWTPFTHELTPESPIAIRFCFFGPRVNIAIEDILNMSAKALALEGGLAEAHASRRLALSLGERYEEAETEFKEAIALDRNSFEGHYFYARSLFQAGQTRAGSRTLQRVAEIDPEDYQSPALSIQIYRSLGRQAEMQNAARMAVNAQR